ncbi:MAG TPA: HAD family hydrolase [Blastocatellia bacterium]
MAIKAVSFDFWNTLFTEPADGFRFYAYRRYSMLSDAVSEHRPVTDDEIRLACHAEAQHHHSVWITEHRTLGVEERVSNCLIHLNVTLPPARISDLAQSFEEGLLERPPILVEGAGETIDYLSRKYRLGIISDVGFSPGRILRQVMRQAGVIDAFDSLVFSDEAGHSKPHRDVFLVTSQALGSPAGEMAHVGDLEHTDVVGAKKAGYRAIRFVGVTPMTEAEESIADAVTPDLRDVPELLRGFDS